jgi:acyl transferase
MSAVAVVMPGFGHRMHQHSSLALYLLVNGISVVRFDSLDHLGLSDGDIEDFTLSTALQGVRTVLDFARDEFPAHGMTLVATSLSARVALRAFADCEFLAGLATVSGVVDVARTLECALGVDYSRVAEDQLPPKIRFEGSEVRAAPFYADARASAWDSLASSVADIAGITRPARLYLGADDAWISLPDVQHLAATIDAVDVVTIAGCGHDIGRNAQASRWMLRDVVAFCGRSDGLHQVREPSFSAMLETGLQERRKQRARA